MSERESAIEDTGPHTDLESCIELFVDYARPPSMDARSIYDQAKRARAELAALRQERDALRATLEDRENVPQAIMDDALYVCRAVAEHLRADPDTKDRARIVLEWDEACPRDEARDALRREAE